MLKLNWTTENLTDDSFEAKLKQAIEKKYPNGYGFQSNGYSRAVIESYVSGKPIAEGYLSGYMKYHFDSIDLFRFMQYLIKTGLHNSWLYELCHGLGIELVEV